jgi:hypothetical protein
VSDDEHFVEAGVCEMVTLLRMVDTDMVVKVKVVNESNPEVTLVVLEVKSLFSGLDTSMV